MKDLKGKRRTLQPPVEMPFSTMVHLPWARLSSSGTGWLAHVRSFSAPPTPLTPAHLVLSDVTQKGSCQGKGTDGMTLFQHPRWNS